MRDEGGATVLGKGKLLIGQRNIEGDHETLRRYNIRIIGDDTGSDYGRTLEASVERGKVTVKSFRHGVKRLV